MLRFNVKALGIFETTLDVPDALFAEEGRLDSLLLPLTNDNNLVAEYANGKELPPDVPLGHFKPLGFSNSLRLEAIQLGDAIIPLIPRKNGDRCRICESPIEIRDKQSSDFVVSCRGEGCPVSFITVRGKTLAEALERLREIEETFIP